MASIALIDLKKRFGAARAVDGVDLRIENGEVMALLGPSGCGKTTTLQLLAGFLEPDAGEIRVDDVVVSRRGSVLPPERRNMSLIFQTYAVWPHKTVFENVAFGLAVRRVPRAQIVERVKHVLETVRMASMAERYPAELSGGQQQRVALARALVVEPQILLLDEPLSNLDTALREQMRFEIRRLHNETGITMVYVTHDQAEAMVTADRIAVMNAGRVEQVGTASQIYESPHTAFAASFICRMNTLEGTVLESGVADCSGLILRVSDGEPLAKGQRAVICVRPHDVSFATGDEVADGQNCIRGRVAQQTYLGDVRDYLVQVAGDTTLRVITSPGICHEVGEEVTLRLPIAACRIVSG
jgi:iron(III) transport system ATP-binding protein